ncbi:putative C6 transcription factor [Xylariomycetidae sp. FL2044]|nr:putative C6 transcription factor [Xylariomycetidae sp. FL2044]
MDEEPSKKRLRTSHACDVCRLRKIRCDGNQPCASCQTSKQECSYGSEANTRGKSDLILEGVLRLEQMLRDMSANAYSPRSPTIPSPISSSLASLPTAAPPPLPPPPPLKNDPTARLSGPPQLLQINKYNLENAILDSLHNSNTESILAWPYFDAFPSLRQNYVSIFQLEQSRSRLSTPRTSSSLYPTYLTSTDLESVLDAFQRGVNFWYPTLSLVQLDAVRTLVAEGGGLIDINHTTTTTNSSSADPTSSSCRAHLVMALGCAGDAVSGLVGSEDGATTITREETEYKASRRAMADMYFDGAMRIMHAAHTEMNCTAVQCHFFTALYFAYLRRPLQAWSYLQSTASKCLLLLSYPPVSEPVETQECLRRIFWGCFILESDYLAELSALPQSGIARIESSIPLPGAFTSHRDPYDNEHASLYFLACVSMRRLLNRTHQLLYARDAGAATDIARFPAIVRELDHQLEEWRDVLPSAFAFSANANANATTAATGADGGGVEYYASECGGFLRQRYLTCKSVIYRPYLAWLLANGLEGVDGIGREEILAGCRVCLDACTFHILGLTGFAHTVLVDTWICVMSMATAMMILLATCHSVRHLTHLRRDIMHTGPHLRKVFRRWQEAVAGPESPSVEQGMRIIYETERLMQGLGAPRNPSSEELEVAVLMSRRGIV